MYRYTAQEPASFDLADGIVHRLQYVQWGAEELTRIAAQPDTKLDEYKENLIRLIHQAERVLDVINYYKPD